MLFLSLILAAQAADTDAAIAYYRSLTAVGPRCGAPADGDIIVCGRRAADRYRVPLIVHTAGDPKDQGVPAERERLLARTSNCAEKSVFLVGCGMAGVTVGTGGVHLGGERPLAP